MGKRKSKIGRISIKELGLNVPITPKTAIAAYAGYKWVGPKISQLVTDGKFPLVKPDMANAAEIAKAVTALGVIMFIPKNYKFGFSSEVDAAALGLAFQAAETYAKAQGWISGRKGGMRMVHRKVGATGDYKNQIAATLDYRNQVAGVRLK